MSINSYFNYYSHKENPLYLSNHIFNNYQYNMNPDVFFPTSLDQHHENNSSVYDHSSMYGSVHNSNFGNQSLQSKNQPYFSKSRLPKNNYETMASFSTKLMNLLFYKYGLEFNNDAICYSYCNLLSLANSSLPSVVLSLQYVNLLVKYEPSLIFEQDSEYKLFVVGLILASKFIEDQTYTNSGWCEISKIELQELNQLEINFLSILNYQLNIPVGLYYRWIKQTIPILDYQEACLFIENTLLPENVLDLFMKQDRVIKHFRTAAPRTDFTKHPNLEMSQCYHAPLRQERTMMDPRENAQLGAPSYAIDCWRNKHVYRSPTQNLFWAYSQDNPQHTNSYCMIPCNKYQNCNSVNLARV